MKKIVLLLFIIFSSHALAKNEIVYVDFAHLLNNSQVAKSLNQQLKAIDNKNVIEFKKIESDLKTKQQKILLQKNIIAKEEYQKITDKFKIEFANFKSDIAKKNKDIINKKNKAENEILLIINTILSEYAKENSILLILDRKSILIGKTELDITTEIIKKLDKKIKKIKLN